MGQTGHGWLTRMVNAMTTQPMQPTDHELLLMAKREESEANGPSVPPGDLTNASRTPANPKRASNPAKTRLTVTLPVPLLDRLRNTVYWTADLTLARLIEQAVAASVDRLEQQHGEPFPPRIESLKGGRPRRVRLEPHRG